MYSNDVAESTERSEVELAVLDLLAAGDERDEDGGSITQRQANDTNAGEGVESSGGAKVDDTEDDLDNHAKHHGIEWHVELRVDSLPQLITGNSTVTGKGPGSAGCGRSASNTTEQTQNEEGHEQANGTTGGPYGVSENDGHWLAGGKGCKHGLVGQDEDQGNQEKQATNSVQGNGSYHGLGYLSGGLSYFFAHTT
ncbi:hypothetical protein GMOD_00008484 [Pyrenophora seminiperda CCB06]|uniref:Uncharacterized protein n=1 Tax=Pyrenophora seminiperda CCB06 TaxID=1302712 RepID=A0A3M7M8X0_9PLEO|nr:hypothetical protein GMOD_00008484 [Pyrenophora seminiperda CCB06]